MNLFFLNYIFYYLFVHLFNLNVRDKNVHGMEF